MIETPYETKPTSMTRMDGTSERLLLSNSSPMSAQVAAVPKPLIIVTETTSFSDSMRVMLFSVPQIAQASRIRSAPGETTISLPGDHERSRLATVMAATAAHMRLPMRSRNMVWATRAVATTSKLPSRDAVDALESLIPARRVMALPVLSPIMSTISGASRLVSAAPRWGRCARSASVPLTSTMQSPHPR